MQVWLISRLAESGIPRALAVGVSITYLPAKEPLQTNDMVDVFTVASLLSFGFLENTPDITSAQIRSTRQMFRNRFAGLSLSSAKMQRTTEFLLYWTTLNALAIKAEPKNENERRVAKNLTANAAIIMTTIGLSPQKYTLSDRGFVEK